MGGVLLHEWIAVHGGSENVFDQIVATFPDADIQCLWNDTGNDRYPGRHISETWLARSPLRRSKAAALPFMPSAWRNLPNNDYQWAVISSHAFAHHATFERAPSDFRKYVYVHTPARYIWTPELDTRGASAGVRAASALLKPLDKKRAAHATALAANSDYVRQRIRNAWDLDATVIYPPVNTERILAVDDWRTELSDEELVSLEELPQEFILGASRFISYKRLDLVIEAGESSGIPVVIAGRGPEEHSLRQKAAEASVPVRFVISPSDAMLYALYQAAAVFVFPPIEDFGIMPVEAMACGARIVVNSVGGAPESVARLGRGVAFEDATPHSIADAIDATDRITSPFDRFSVAKYFSHARFRDELSNFVDRRDGQNLVATPLQSSSRGGSDCFANGSGVD